MTSQVTLAGSVIDPSSYFTVTRLDPEPEPLSLDSEIVQSALRAINKHRARYAGRPLNPLRPVGQVQPWTPNDVLEYARGPEVGWEG